MPKTFLITLASLFVLSHTSALAAVTEREFKATVAHFETVMKPWVQEQFGKQLDVYSIWPGTSEVARAEISGKIWHITITGVFFQKKDATPDVLAGALCHELGHFAGGAPRKIKYPWSSVEGQADYFAAAKCLKRLYRADNSRAVVSKLKVDPVVKNRCDEQFSETTQRDLCKRIAMGAYHWTKAETDRDSSWSWEDPPEFSTPSSEVARVIQDQHPDIQCRLDTYLAGALCAADPNELTSSDDPDKGYCTHRNKEPGARPLCWYVEE